MEARWWAVEAKELGTGPREVVIRLADDASPAVRAKGFNTGVMRRAEVVVRELVAEVHGREEMGERDIFLDTVARRVGDLPERGPRSRTGDYYGGLLALYEEIAVVSEEPASILAKAMGLSRSTVKSQIQRARTLRDERSNG